jgi:hypothetical protein
MTRKGANSPVKMGFGETSVRIAIADIQPLRLVSSGALPWFESYADQDWITKMLLRHMG